MEKGINAGAFLTDIFPARWTALKYLEVDEQVVTKGKETNPALSQKLETVASRVAEHLQKTLDTYPEAIIADHRYGFITSLLKGGIARQKHDTDRLFLSDQVDKLLTHRFLGPLIMMLILYVVYQFTFKYSQVPVQWIDSGFSALGSFMESIMPAGPLKSLVVSGIIDGVGGIIGFVPLILFMFFAIAFLEDTGYLARVAFMLDRVFRTFGLHGSSVMAFIISGGIAGGCAVPGVMATRTLRSSRERLATILTAPFMNCGAKLPVFAMLIAAFFPGRRAMMLFLLTLLSWIAALLLAKLLRMTLLRGPSTPFLLELPPYRLPTFKGLLIHTWERTWQYIRKAGTIILAISILFWALMSFPGLSDSERNAFESKKQGVLSEVPEALKPVVSAWKASEPDSSPEAAPYVERLRDINREASQTALRHSFAGRFGNAMETVDPALRF